MTTFTHPLDFSKIENLKDQTSPLYHKYQGQNASQPAYIYLTEDGSVYADYSGEIGNARPVDEWHGRTLTWNITPYLSGKAIYDVVMDEQVKTLLGAIHGGHSVEWDGNNHVGVLTGEAREAYGKLEGIFAEVEGDVEVWSVEDWLFSGCNLFDHWPAGEATLEEVVAELEGNIESNQVIDGDIADALLDSAKWKIQQLRPGLDENHIDALIKNALITEGEAQDYRDAMEDVYGV